MSAIAYLEKKVNEVKDESLVAQLNEMKEYHVKKLWHQLTISVLLLLQKKEVIDQFDLKEFYLELIMDFEHRIDAVSLCRIMFIICEVLVNKAPEWCVEHTDKLIKKVNKNNEAFMMARLLRASLYLKNAPPADNSLVEARALLEAVSEDLLDKDGVSIVHQLYYELNCTYLETQNDYAAYYRDALRYLGTVDMDNLSKIEKYNWAKKLAISALLGKDVYNFGELMLCGILKSLEDTSDAFLLPVLDSFHRGDLNKFEELSLAWQAVEVLSKQKTFLTRKITLMCLMELIFHRPPNLRTFKFQEIAEATHMPEKEVEFLIIHALSKGIVKGRIDEVDKSVNFTWLKPKILDMAQIQSIANRFKVLADVSKETALEAQKDLGIRWESNYLKS